MMNIKVEIRIDTSKDKVKNQHCEIQRYANSPIIIIYMDGSGIKSRIDIVVYDPITDKRIYQEGYTTQYVHSEGMQQHYY